MCLHLTLGIEFCNVLCPQAKNDPSTQSKLAAAKKPDAAAAAAKKDAGVILLDRQNTFLMLVILCHKN